MRCPNKLHLLKAPLKDFDRTNRIDEVVFVPFGQSLRGVNSAWKAISIAGLSEIPKATQSYPDDGTLYSLK